MIQKRAPSELRKNTGTQLTRQLCNRIIKAVRKTPHSLKAAAQAVGLQPPELRYILKRGSLPNAPPLWEHVSVRCREVLAEAEAKNYRRLVASANGGIVPERTYSGDREVETKYKVIPASATAQAEIQRLLDRDTWQIQPGPEEAPIVYMDLFSRPYDLPPEILNALIANGWSHAALSNSGLGPASAGDDQPALAEAGEPDPA